MKSEGQCYCLCVSIALLTWREKQVTKYFFFLLCALRGRPLYLRLTMAKKNIAFALSTNHRRKKKILFFFFSLLHCRNPSLIALHSLSHVSLFSLVDYFRLTPTIDITGRYFYFLGRKERHSYHRLMKISSKHFLIWWRKKSFERSIKC